jgi:hypothetical protein
VDFAISFDRSGLFLMRNLPGSDESDLLRLVSATLLSLGIDHQQEEV